MTNTITTQAIIGECYDCGERAVLQSFEYEENRCDGIAPPV